MARNEALFREVNERIEDVQKPLAAEERIDFLCECGNDDCTQPISLTLAEYERIRQDPQHFVVVPGHDVVDVERIVERTDRYAVVEKLPGAPAKIALERDPRG
jgi:5-bromo-4-chloroindolyl phosphate hydrolysis protein